jgi:hypothetical protein
MTSSYDNFTLKFNQANTIDLDVANADEVIVQIVGGTGTYTFSTSLETVFVNVTGKNVTTNADTTTITTAGIVKIPNAGRILRIAGTNPVTALLVKFNFLK